MAISLSAQVAVILALASATIISTEPVPSAENVCNTRVPIKKDITIEKPIQYEIEYRGMCGLIPCMKKRTETRFNVETRASIQYMEKPSCCPGYAETPDRKCAPICLRSCNNGAKCIAPNTCKCSNSPNDTSPGFAGPTCNRFTCLGENHWGSKCDKECNCPVNAYCSANTGKCLCYPGFKGSNCSEECERDSSDVECQEVGELPMISDPDVNLIPGSSLRQHSEALVLERTPDETLLQYDNRKSFGAPYLVGVLACVSLISLLGFLVIKRRYDRLKTELCNASGRSSSDSNYSGSSYYATSGQTQAANYSEPVADDMLRKNLSFAAATRHILLGQNENAKQQVNNTQDNHDISNRNKLILNPLVESRLIRNQQQAEKNVYSEVKVPNFLDRPLPEPNVSSTSISIDDESEQDHIYQVPRRLGEIYESLDHEADDVNKEK